MSKRPNATMPIDVKPGDRVRYIQGSYPDMKKGDLFTVLRIERRELGTGALLDNGNGGMNDYHWYLWPYEFELLPEMPTEEELKSAKPLPSIKDVADFFRIKL